MQYGVLTLVDTYPEEQPLAERYQQIIELAIHAEKVGFDFFWVGEHHGSEFYCSPSPLSLLSAIAQATNKIRIGPGVCQLAHHDPIRVAEDYAMLDVISHGRLDMAIGRPTFMKGFHALNQRISESAQRNEEAIGLVRRLWSETAVTHQGTFFQTSGSQCHPQPLQGADVPFYQACNSPGGAQFAARMSLHLAALSIFGEPKKFRPIVDAYRAATPTGKVCAGRHVFVDEHHDSAQQVYAPFFDRYVKGLCHELAYRPDPKYDIEQPPVLKEYAPMAKSLYADLPIEERIQNQALCGSPETIQQQMNALINDLGELDAFWGLFDVGAMPTERIKKSMTLFAQSLIS